MTFRHFRLTSERPDGAYAEIEIDGVPQRDVTRAVVIFEPREPIRVELDYIGSIELDAPARIEGLPRGSAEPAEATALPAAERLIFRSFDGGMEARLAQGDHCVAVEIHGGRGGYAAIVLDDVEAEAMAASLVRRVKASRA